ncbi:hypothetical protein Pcinc_018242 [Petrolisthes cinctipes]|uniref:Uncharacterized protein n=1 Tax=Petrolisthes cinctipes TaxID=88211 RepID=A0AAE1KJG1_PETCI|nr:hypothetical protein Pcinc_018242 [Petrolisthes cinctipes]
MPEVYHAPQPPGGWRTCMEDEPRPSMSCFNAHTHLLFRGRFGYGRFPSSGGSPFLFPSCNIYICFLLVYSTFASVPLALLPLPSLSSLYPRLLPSPLACFPLTSTSFLSPRLLPSNFDLLPLPSPSSLSPRPPPSPLALIPLPSATPLLPLRCHGVSGADCSTRPACQLIVTGGRGREGWLAGGWSGGVVEWVAVLTDCDVRRRLTERILKTNEWRDSVAGRTNEEETGHTSGSTCSYRKWLFPSTQPEHRGASPEEVEGGPRRGEGI